MCKLNYEIFIDQPTNNNMVDTATANQAIILVGKNASRICIMHLRDNLDNCLHKDAIFLLTCREMTAIQEGIVVSCLPPVYQNPSVLGQS